MENNNKNKVLLNEINELYYEIESCKGDCLEVYHAATCKDITMEMALLQLEEIIDRGIVLRSMLQTKQDALDMMRK